jgi:alpha-tubulin suppressor-like RCC1 family protein
MLKSKRFQQVFIGENCTFALTGNGELFGWGKELVDFQSGEKQYNEPQLLPFPSKNPIIHVSVGPKHAAAVDNQGIAYTWGQNGNWFQGGGQLGLGHRQTIHTPTPVTFLSEKLEVQIQMVACGNNHTLFLTKDREVFAAGVGEYGRLGTGDTSDQKHPVPINTSMLIPVDGSKNSAEEEDVTAIAAGPEHSLLLTAKGKVASWGRNMSGQLGHGDSYMDMYSMEDLPRPIDLIDDDNSNPTQVIFKQITAGSGRSAALTQQGEVYLWGARLSHKPQKFGLDVFGGEKVKKIVIGGESNKSAIFFLTATGKVYVMGDARSLLLASDKYTESSVGKVSQPMLISYFADKEVVDIYAGFGQHVFAKVKVSE